MEAWRFVADVVHLRPGCSVLRVFAVALWSGGLVWPFGLFLQLVAASHAWLLFRLVARCFLGE